MALYDYNDALKLGRRKYQESVLTGKHPYLPVLDEVLSYTEIVAEISLGVMDIPLDKIVGTRTAGRTNAFAKNFMPLLPEKSEFAVKWATLYDHQINEGIREPIVVYEFMNKYYVQEGNKRVSVMKYVGAYSIAANVTRLLPKKTDNKDSRLYYEFLDFNRVSFNNDVWFSEEGQYDRLLESMGRTRDEIWDKELQQEFRAVYGQFANAFDQAGGHKLDLTCADAFLIYVEIYGYDEVKNRTERLIYQDLKQMWQEVQLASGGKEAELVEHPQDVEEQKFSLLNKLFQSGEGTASRLKIGFVYAMTPETSSWAYGHELGRTYLEQAFEGKLKTRAYTGADTEEDVEQAIEQAIADGCNVIFTTEARMVNQSVRSAIKHPEVKIHNCSVRLAYSSICTYHTRMYEAKFLMGAIAAALSRTERLGYIADYPIYGNIANINAFALGARMINPNVKVYLTWSGIKGANAQQELIDQGVRLIFGKEMITPKVASREYGLYYKSAEGEVHNLAAAICHWGKVYESIIKIILRGDDENARGKKAVNYWWGMSAGVIEVICPLDMPHGTHRLIEFLKSAISSGSFQPFDGLIYSQNGVVQCEEGQSLNPRQIITMNWLAENVIGRIPDAEELTEEAQALLKLQGVRVDESTRTEER